VTARELPSDPPAFDDPEVVNPFLLPDGAHPRRYDLTLEPDLAAATFTGSARIAIDLDGPTTELCCNALELIISRARVETGDSRILEASTILLDPETERATFSFAEPISGSIALHLDFAGELNDKLRGFYRSTFTDAEGVEQVIATTQFEATDARRAFPCWDEPAHKAVFAITLVVDADLFAVSNAAEISRTPDPDRPGKHIVRFADTMIMSTYLVAFVVGPLEATEPVDVDGTPLRIVYPKGKGHLTGFALEVAAAGLRHFAEYYAITYPGDKVDLVAVPDFAFGAMENLGCITFREILLLVDPDTTTQAELLNVTDVINHELAHMWFGDLVTMKWWNGIWLNEAFATFMEMHATDAFRPEWDRWVSFGLARTAAFDTDALTSTRAIEYPVVSPADAEGMFDILTYEKGAAVVRMLEAYLEPEVFRNGIRSYLAAHAHGNTETTDLWDAIEDTSGQPVRSIMDSWIFQGGHPLISIDLINDGRTLRLTQHRFGYAGDLGEGTGPTAAHDDTSRWIVPVMISQRTIPDGVITFEKVLLDRPSMDIELVEPALWVLGNTEGTGFYRVNHAPQLLAALVAHAHRDLSPIERYGLIDDAWASVLAGRTSAHEFMLTLDAFHAETDLSVWQRIIAGLGALDRLLEGAARDAFETRVRALLAPAITRLGDTPIDGETDRDRALRGVLFEALGVLGSDPASQERARVILGLTDGGEPPADIDIDSDIADADADAGDAAMRAAAVSIVAASGTLAEFDIFVERMHRATTPQDELRYLAALADFPDADAMRRLLAMSITDAVRTQNAPMVLRRAMTNRDNGELAWFFVAAEWDTINARFPSNSIARLLEGVRSLSRPSTAQEVLAFFEAHEVPQGDKILAQHLERLEVSVALRQRESDRLAAELLEHHRFLHRH
jgi:puromycin-sensitive aminopeptidase